MVFHIEMQIDYCIDKSLGLPCGYPALQIRERPINIVLFLLNETFVPVVLLLIFIHIMNC